MAESAKPEPVAALAEERLRALADEERAEQMAAYLKTDDPFFGVMATPRREVLKALKAEFRPTNRAEYESRIRALWERPHRETRYLAIDFARAYVKKATLETLPLFEDMIRTGQWWDFVDPIAAHLVGALLDRYPDEVSATLNEWVSDDDMWVRRSAIIAQLGRKETTDEEMLFDFCRQRLHEKEFFVRKAIGWALRDYSYVAPDAVCRFLTEHRDELSGLSYREGAKQLRRTGLMD